MSLEKVFRLKEKLRGEKNEKPDRFIFVLPVKYGLSEETWFNYCFYFNFICLVYWSFYQGKS
jgi:hypothetical protein